MTEELVKKYKAQFPFGRRVSYSTTLKRVFAESKAGFFKTWQGHDLKRRRIGYVTGWRWLSNGDAVHSHEDGVYYIATHSVFALEVKYAMLNKPDLVLPSACETENFQPQIHPIPDREYHLDDKAREALREYAKTAKRVKGRWAK